MKADTERQHLYIRWHHHNHAPYLDVRTQAGIKEYIDDNLDKTPQQLFADICAKSDLDSTNLSQAKFTAGGANSVKEYGLKMRTRSYLLLNISANILNWGKSKQFKSAMYMESVASVSVFPVH